MKNVFNSTSPVATAEVRISDKGALRSFCTHSLKRISFSVVFILAAYGLSFAQNQRGDLTHKLRKNEMAATNQVDKIPIRTVNEFEMDFNNVDDVTWKVENGFNEADFRMNDKSMMAFFNYDDELIGTGSYVDYAELPEKGKEKITKDYPDYSIEKIMYFEDANADDEDFLNFFGNFLKDKAYFVLLRNNEKEIVVQVTDNGDVSYFSNVR